MQAKRRKRRAANQRKRVGKDRVASTLWAMERSRKDVAEFFDKRSGRAERIQSHYRRTDMSMLVIDEVASFVEELTPEFIKSAKFLG